MDRNTDLQSLVDNPRETMECELKSWLDLSDKLHQASIARHIAALSNHGGGYIAFGIDDDLSTAANAPEELIGYSQDVIGQIVRKYLSPKVECQVDFVKSSRTAVTHPVVSVASHGSTPVVTIADGPHDTKGRPQGITIATYYVRSSQPESKPIGDHSEWQPLIQRCVMHERDGLLRGIAAIMGNAPTSATYESLKQWQDRVMKAYLEVVAQLPADSWPVPLSENNCQFSFRVLQEQDDTVPVGQLKRDLLQIHEEVRRFISTGWGCFMAINRSGLEPKILVEAVNNADVEVLESNLVRDRADIRELWKLSTNGWGSLVRTYLHDLHPSMRVGCVSDPGTVVAPTWEVSEVLEFVKTARSIAARFPTAHSIELRVAYRGLNGRKLVDPGTPILFGSGPATAAGREFGITASLPDIDAHPYEIVAKLLTPIFVLFDGYELRPNWVEVQTLRLRQRS